MNPLNDMLFIYLQEKITVEDAQKEVCKWNNLLDFVGLILEFAIIFLFLVVFKNLIVHSSSH